MLSRSYSHTARHVFRSHSRTSVKRLSRSVTRFAQNPRSSDSSHIHSCTRSFQSSSSQPNLLTPNEPSTHVSASTPISTEKYHDRADTYIDSLVSQLEQLQEEREDVDCEYSAGVLTLVFPPIGTYVLNKQPPNKQIWLSSPVSGPKRYDYADGEWVYLRDGSTLTALLRDELKVEMDEEQVGE